jgi:hypothetical protein
MEFLQEVDMHLERVRSVFSQFDTGIQVRCCCDGTTVVADIDERELASFARMLVDLADDCMRKLDDDKYTEAAKFISEALEALSN